jgi:bifunctional DNase/RNase
MPTAIDRDFLDMPVTDVRRVPAPGQVHYVVLLQEADSGRRLPIWVGREAATEIALRLLGHGSQLARPLGSNLTTSLIQALGGSLREVRIDRLTQGTFHAAVVVDGPQGTVDVDARPSDALALALVVGAPVRADRQVVEAIEASEIVTEALAQVDSQEAAGPRAILEELAAPERHQDPPE